MMMMKRNNQTNQSQNPVHNFSHQLVKTQVSKINVILKKDKTFFFPFSAVDSMPAWSARVSSNTIPQYAVAIVSSNLWPGAHAFAAGRYKLINKVCYTNIRNNFMQLRI